MLPCVYRMMSHPSQRNSDGHLEQAIDRLPHIKGISYEKDEDRWCVRVPQEFCSYGAPLYFSAKRCGALQSWRCALAHWGNTVICHLSNKDDVCRCKGCHSLAGRSQDKHKITAQDFPDSSDYVLDATEISNELHGDVEGSHNSSVCGYHLSPVHCRCFGRTSHCLEGNIFNGDFDTASRVSCDECFSREEFLANSGYPRNDYLTMKDQPVGDISPASWDSSENTVSEDTGIFPLEPIPQRDHDCAEHKRCDGGERTSPSNRNFSSQAGNAQDSSFHDTIMTESPMKMSLQKHTTPEKSHSKFRPIHMKGDTRASHSGGISNINHPKDLHRADEYSRTTPVSPAHNRMSATNVSHGGKSTRIPVLDDGKFNAPQQFTFNAGIMAPFSGHILNRIRKDEPLEVKYQVPEFYGTSMERLATDYIASVNSPIHELSSTPLESTTPETHAMRVTLNTQEEMQLHDMIFGDHYGSRHRQANAEEKERNNYRSVSHINQEQTSGYKDDSDEEYCVDDDLEDDSGVEEDAQVDHIVRRRGDSRPNISPADIAESLKPWCRDIFWVPSISRWRTSFTDENGTRHTKTFTPYVFGGVEEAYRAAVEYKLSLDRICGAFGLTDTQRLILKRKVELGLKRKRLGRSQREPFVAYSNLGGETPGNGVSSQFCHSKTLEANRNLVSLLMRTASHSSVSAGGTSNAVSGPILTKPYR